MGSLLISLVCAMSIVNWGGVKRPPQRITVNLGQERLKEGAAADRESAIKVATDKAVRTYGSLSWYRVLSCEENSSWRVFFEPDPSLGKGVLVYVVEKSNGRIVNERELPLIPEQVHKGEKRIPAAPSISKDRALAIAKKDAGHAYGSLQKYEVTVCELSRAWFVAYAPRTGLDGGGPEYVIDKETARTIDKKYYQ